MKFTKEFLHNQYVTLKKSGYQISKEFDCPRHSVENALVKFKIPKRTLLEARLPKESSGKDGFKWCNSCSKDKKLAEFNIGNNRFGLDAYCRECVSKKSKKYFDKRNKKRFEIKKNLVLDFGNKCGHCGVENLPIASYVFHHHSEKMSDKNYLQPSDVISGKNQQMIMSERKKWILLCSNCHSVLHSIYKDSAIKFE